MLGDLASKCHCQFAWRLGIAVSCLGRRMSLKQASTVFASASHLIMRPLRSKSEVEGSGDQRGNQQPESCAEATRTASAQRRLRANSNVFLCCLSSDCLFCSRFKERHHQAHLDNEDSLRHVSEVLMGPMVSLGSPRPTVVPKMCCKFSKEAPRSVLG